MSLSFSGNINELVFVGSGDHRDVYVHPNDNRKCIKVMRSKHANNSGEKKYQIGVMREHAYYNVLARRGISYNHIARYHGEIWINYNQHTQLASVFDLIRNDSGEISKTLDTELCRDEVDTDKLADAMHELYVYLLRYKIISGFKMKNILVQHTRHAPPKCIMVDNIGNSDFIPICDYVDWLADRKIERRWRKFISKSLIKNRHNPAITQTMRKAYDNAFHRDK